MSATEKQIKNLQPSKKGRKAWRKNIDLDDIEKKLEERRVELIEQGKPVEELESNELFYIDDEADDKISEKMKRDHVKVLKSTEILSNKSKVPAVANNRADGRKRKVEGISKREIHKLMRLAGRELGVSSAQARIEKDGLINMKAYDLWGKDEESSLQPSEKKQRKIPEILRKFNGNSYTHATVVPETMKMPPIKVREVEIIPHEGKSYNPAFDSWRELINRESFKESSKEKQWLALKEEQKRIQYLIDNFDDEADIVSDSEEEKPENETDYKLSVNAVTETKIKTRAKRNKEKRFKQKNKLLKEIRSLKDTIKQIEHLPEIMKMQEEREKEQAKRDFKLEAQQREKRRVEQGKKKLGSKYTIREGPLEVKLSDELGDSLRKLKPEGDLFLERMNKIVATGKMEAWRKTAKKEGQKKITEKWSYKDFK
ncbi:hypothetical protein FOA43_001518 [Brettanomyces nanus]|uniref:Ribosome biogenesis protein NOP53 n=1 Tax=Eeniella nana TaxID=13502 RepID=A0A875S4M9_EENNA|nr:uncharacterized protein FOA43_001518 [Brettanomyces nanus]QPG74194.1 hypothetical protein FOA43_001518 [Brettanomyces nanus]